MATWLLYKVILLNLRTSLVNSDGGKKVRGKMKGSRIWSRCWLYSFPLGIFERMTKLRYEKIQFAFKLQLVNATPSHDPKYEYNSCGGDLELPSFFLDLVFPEEAILQFICPTKSLFFSPTTKAVWVESGYRVIIDRISTPDKMRRRRRGPTGSL